MPTIFTRIIDGELPARFVWKDSLCVAFLSINPLRPGHVLVVPREEVDHWLDIDPASGSHLAGVSQVIGKALMLAFRPTKVGMTIVGLEVPHMHIHLVPIDGLGDMDFGGADRSPSPASLDDAARRIREALRAMGRSEVVD